MRPIALALVVAAAVVLAVSASASRALALGGDRIAYAAGASLVVVSAVGRSRHKEFPVPAVAAAHLAVRAIRWSRSGTALFYVRQASSHPGP